MDKYILDGQYGKYLEMIGVKVGEALKEAGVPEDLFSRKKPVLDEADYYRFMDAVGNQITDPSLPIAIASADNIESFSPPILRPTAAGTERHAWKGSADIKGSSLQCGMNCRRKTGK